MPDLECAPEHVQVVSEIAAERERHFYGEGYSAEHDDQHDRGELAMAAAAYVLHEPKPGNAVFFWPWHQSQFRPGETRRNLVKAAALIVAEIERIDRAADRQKPGGPL